MFCAVYQTKQDGLTTTDGTQKLFIVGGCGVIGCIAIIELQEAPGPDILPIWDRSLIVYFEAELEMTCTLSLTKTKINALKDILFHKNLLIVFCFHLND